MPDSEASWFYMWGGRGYHQSPVWVQMMVQELTLYNVISAFVEETT